MKRAFAKYAVLFGYATRAHFGKYYEQRRVAYDLGVKRTILLLSTVLFYIAAGIFVGVSFLGMSLMDNPSLPVALPYIFISVLSVPFIISVVVFRIVVVPKCTHYEKAEQELLAKQKII